jgi:hypothetical protein
MIFEEALEQGILDIRLTDRLKWLTMGWLLKNQFDDMDMWDRSKRDEKREKQYKEIQMNGIKWTTIKRTRDHLLNG